MEKEKFCVQKYIELVCDCLERKCGYSHHLNMDSVLNYCLRKIEALQPCDENIIREIIDTSIGTLIVGGNSRHASDSNSNAETNVSAYESVVAENIIDKLTASECSKLISTQEKRISDCLDCDFEYSNELV